MNDKIKSLLCSKSFWFSVAVIAAIICAISFLMPGHEKSEEQKKSEDIIPEYPEKETFTVNGVSFDMVRVKGGTFEMGSDDSDAFDNEKPVHPEPVKNFYIGSTEVTQDLWKAVMGSNPSEFRGGNLPVENVSWYDCQEFCNRLSALTGRKFRLPTEAEWEYAARGGNRSRGYKYSGGDDIGSVAWYDGNSNYKTHPVASKQANELGLYDLSGNVCEWTSGFYSSNYRFKRGGSFRVYRGSSCLSDARRCRSAFRDGLSPDSRGDFLGLRLAI
mgnify:CR=1 FL=1